MTRLLVFISVFFVMVAGTASGAGAPQLSALEIFDGMIHYECDQLAKEPNTSDYHCKVTQTVEKAGTRTMETVEKDLYFMIPIYQLHISDGKPVYYVDDDLLVITLEGNELRRERDVKIDGVDCYAIRTTPVDPAFSRFNVIYCVAKDDFRHVRTTKHGSSSELDNTITTSDYTYGPAGSFTLLQKTVAVTTDTEGTVLHTVTAEYTDYEFNIGLTLEFFAEWLADWRPNPIWN